MSIFVAEYNSFISRTSDLAWLQLCTFSSTWPCHGLSNRIAIPNVPSHSTFWCSLLSPWKLQSIRVYPIFGQFQCLLENSVQRSSTSEALPAKKMGPQLTIFGTSRAALVSTTPPRHGSLRLAAVFQVLGSEVYTVETPWAEGFMMIDDR